MTRPYLIAKLIFAAMGVYFLMRFLNSIYSAVWNLNLKCSTETPTWGMPVIIAGLVITLTASLILLFWSDWLARLMVGPDVSQFEKVDSRWIITGFRIIVCLCGLLILYWPISLLIPAIINSPRTLFDVALKRQEFPLPTRTIGIIVTHTIKGLLGIYLIFGAPHYVRWQTRAIAAKTRGEK
jgi:Zn-dependent protease with chaperone function